MNEIIEILSGLHPDIDFETADNLVDSKILDSFDIVTSFYPVYVFTKNISIRINLESSI